MVRILLLGNSRGSRGIQGIFDAGLKVPHIDILPFLCELQRPVLLPGKCTRCTLATQRVLFLSDLALDNQVVEVCPALMTGAAAQVKRYVAPVTVDTNTIPKIGSTEVSGRRGGGVRDAEDVNGDGGGHWMHRSITSSRRSDSQRDQC